MSTTELKEKLIVEIKNTDNGELLLHISDLIEFESNSAAVYEMSQDEIEAVNDGLEQLKSGKWISHKEVKRQTDEWLKK